MKKLSNNVLPTKKLLIVALALVSLYTATLAVSNPKNIKQGLARLLGETPAYFSNVSNLNISEPIFGFSVSGDISFTDSGGSIRFILIDRQGREYLIYEAYPLITDTLSFPFQNKCEETCLLNAITPEKIRVEGNSAKFSITELFYTPESLISNTSNLPSDIQNSISANKLLVDNRKISLLSRKKTIGEIGWTAGNTAISRMTYQEKKKLFPNPDGTLAVNLPNLQGAEYYTGGIFNLPEIPTDTSRPEPIQQKSISLPLPKSITTLPTQDTLAYLSSTAVSTKPRITIPSIPSLQKFPETWDWRNRHGTNWLTPVKTQGHCGSCWAFSSVGALEAVTNLYFNQPINPDFSEQDLLSCSTAGTCGGGRPGEALNYFRIIGAIPESCFGYTASNLICQKCEDWASKTTKISGFSLYPTNAGEKWIKEKIIKNGPITSGIYSWRHAMTMAGWETDPVDNQTVWIFKNSWGENWGENGYLRIKLINKNISPWSYAVNPPILSYGNTLNIACRDNDSDGYCNWGISETMPESCNQNLNCHPEKDCDDTNANLGPFTQDYTCQSL